MKKLMIKILTAVLSLAMAACFVPQMNAPAYAEDGSDSIQLDTSTAAPPSGMQDIDLDIIVHDATYPDEIVCIVSSNADGEYALTIANVQATITVKGGLGSYSAGHLESGNYQAKVIFEGNSNYNSGSSETTFSVRPQDAGTNFAVKADPAEVTEGDTVTIIPTLPEDVTGTVKYYLGTSTDGKLLGETSVGENLELSTKNGNALLAGTHAITASYTGDYTHIPAVRTVLVAVNHAPADAEDEVPAMVARAESVLKSTANTDNAQTVWYAGKPWRVISFDGTGNEYTKPSDAMTLFSSGLLEKGKKFNPDESAETANDYAGSDLQNTVNSLYSSLFSEKEQKAVINRPLSVEEYSNSSPYSTGISGTETSGHLWPLSTAEAYVLPSDTFRSVDALWWLRSPGTEGRDAAFVRNDGTVEINGLMVSYSYGVRPAFDFNLKSVLFTSAAEGGKYSGDVGAYALKEVGTNDGSEWKLTLLDDGTITGLDGHKDFALSQVTEVENGVSVKYTGAQPGNNEYISAVITDKPITEDGAAIKYYGRIAEASTANGTVTINTAGKLGENDHLYVFNEQYNGDKKTDYASVLQEVKIPELISYTVTFKVKNGSWNDGTKTDQKVTLSRYDNEDKALVLQPGDIPKVGNKPANGYKAGSWDVTPETDTQVSKDMTYTYTYAKADNPSPPKPQPPTPTPSADKAATKIALDAGVVAKSSGSKVTASWGAVKGASSYVIYANYCDQKKLKKIRTVSGKITSFDITKLNGKKFDPKKNLKFYVVAYKTVKGKKVKLAKSIMAHAPGSKNSKRTNVTGVKVKKASFTLKKGKTAKIKAKLILQKKGKKPLKHCAKFRYVSSNKKVAKVSKKGKITAVGKGKCTVYVYAVSGVSKKIKVTVK